jgi:hypothetical protein
MLGNQKDNKSSSWDDHSSFRMDIFSNIKFYKIKLISN